MEGINEKKQILRLASTEEKCWRTSGHTFTFILFLETITAIPMVTTAILPSLLDDIYARNYACATGNGIGKEREGYSCRYENKALLIGILASYTTLGEALAAPTILFIIRTLGVRWTCIISCILRVIGSMATGFATNLWILFVARFLNGFPAVYTLVALFATVSEKFPNDEERKRAVSMGLQGYLACNLISYFCGTIIYDYLGLLYTYVFITIFILVELLFCLLVKNPDVGVDATAGYMDYLGDFDSVLALIYGMFAWLLFATWQAVTPDWLFTKGATTSHIGIIIGLATLCQTFLSFLFTKLRFQSHWLSMLVPQTASVVGFLSLPYTGGIFWLSMLPDILILVSYCCVLSSVNTIITSTDHHSPLVINNLFTLLMDVGVTTGGMFGGGLYQAIGARNTYFVTATLAAALSVGMICKPVYEFVCTSKHKCDSE